MNDIPVPLWVRLRVRKLELEIEAKTVNWRSLFVSLSLSRERLYYHS